MCRFIRILMVGVLLALGTTARAGNPRWQGVFATVATPFNGDGTLHVPALEAQLAHVLRHAVDGIVILDRHGEGPYLDWNERVVVLQAAKRMAFPRVPIVVGIEADCLDAALQQTAQAKKHGASAVLVRYLGSRPEEALGFFYCLSEKNLLPILYDHDRGTLPARTVGHILRVPNVIGMREANLDLVEARAHLKVCASTGKSCFAGSTRDLGRFLCAGGHGVMCPEATLLPGQTRFVYRASRHGHGREACAVCEELEQVSAAVNATAPAGNGVVLALHRLVPASEPTSDVEAPAALKYGLTCVGVEMPEYTRCPAPVMIVEQSRRTVLARLRNRSQVAPVPYSQGNGQQNWGALLRTGGFQLAPGVSHDLLRSQGDGLWGFPIGN